MKIEKYKNFARTIEEGLDEENKLVMRQLDLEIVRMMPDCHKGKGCSIGFTGLMKDRIHPNIVGVDIGCGMTVLEFTTSESLSQYFDEVDSFIREEIALISRKNSPYKLDLSNSKSKVFSDEYNLQLGTLGGGNHFIEIGQDTLNNENYYLIVHSGSRKYGSDTCSYYTKKIGDNSYEIEEMINLLKSEGREREIASTIREIGADKKDYLRNRNMEEYINEHNCCVKFASQSRSIMVNEIFEFISKKIAISKIDEWESVHNFIDPEDNIIRKGATPSRKGQKLIIPMNMSFGSLIGVGLGNSDWNYSAPHGAGRVLSRTKAKEELSLDEALISMDGIFTKSLNEETLDEAPKTYKNPTEIIELTDGKALNITAIVKPIFNFKNK